MYNLLSFVDYGMTKRFKYALHLVRIWCCCMQTSPISFVARRKGTSAALCITPSLIRRVQASRWVPKILGTCCDRLTHSAHCLT